MGYSINGVTKIITLTPGTTEVSVRDLWSRWVEWALTSDNSKYLPAFINVGGDSIDVVAGTSIPVYVFLQNGWKIKPQEANHTLIINDGVLVDASGDPFINTTGSFIVRINYSQPVQAITVATGGGGGGLTFDQDMRILKMFQALMLDPTAPVTNTPDQISFSDVVIDLVGDPEVSVVGTRQ